MTCVIFDLDGTLVESDDFDGECFVAAVRSVIGTASFSTNWANYRHVTDSGILQEILDDNQLGDRPEIAAEIREAFGARVRHYLDGGGICEPVQGARSTIEELLARGVKPGIATGDWKHTASMKLAHAGIPTCRLELACCDDAMDRVGIMHACMNQLGGRVGSTTYVGDGPWDVTASEQAGMSFIGVGQRLNGRCARWVPDLRGFVDLL